MKNKVFVSWSGGKDCCYAAYLAQKQGYRIECLLNMVTQNRERSCSHGMAAERIRLQSDALGIPVIQKPTTGDNYEAVFTESIKELKQKGVATGIFGDIDFSPHREWIERICANGGVEPVLPLWQMDQGKIMRDFIAAGFKTVVVAVRRDLLEREWVGRIIDLKFLDDLAALGKNITPCGESGEFHSLVIDGPLFKKRINILKTETVQRDNHWFLDIKECKLEEK